MALPAPACVRCWRCSHDQTTPNPSVLKPRSLLAVSLSPHRHPKVTTPFSRGGRGGPLGKRHCPNHRANAEVEGAGTAGEDQGQALNSPGFFAGLKRGWFLQAAQLALILRGREASKRNCHGGPCPWLLDPLHPPAWDEDRSAADVLRASVSAPSLGSQCGMPCARHSTYREHPGWAGVGRVTGRPEAPGAPPGSRPAPAPAWVSASAWCPLPARQMARFPGLAHDLTCMASFLRPNSSDA